MYAKNHHSPLIADSCKERENFSHKMCFFSNCSPPEIPVWCRLRTCSTRDFLLGTPLSAGLWGFHSYHGTMLPLIPLLKDSVLEKCQDSGEMLFCILNLHFCCFHDPKGTFMSLSFLNSTHNSHHLPALRTNEGPILYHPPSSPLSAQSYNIHQFSTIYPILRLPSNSPSSTGVESRLQAQVKETLRS